MEQFSEIYCSNPRADYLQAEHEIKSAINRVIDSGRYILGAEVNFFEQEFATYLDRTYAVGVGSGTDALILAMRASGIQAGDEVITVAHTALATIAAILTVGAIPVICDIDATEFCIDENKIEELITNKTKVIIPVHIYGNACRMDVICKIGKKYNLTIIEDCAQAAGASYQDKKIGSYGDFACFSFYPTKNLSALGDGGAIVTNDEISFKLLQKMRQYGWDENRRASIVSNVSRLDEIQAAVLRVKLKHLDAANMQRIKIANLYNNIFKDIARVPLTRRDTMHVYHLYVLVSDNRAELAKDLKEIGLNTMIHYPTTALNELGYKDNLIVKKELHNMHDILTKIISIPIYPGLNIEELQQRLAYLKVA